MHLIRTVCSDRLNPGFSVKMQGQSLADIGQRHTIAAVMIVFGAIRITQHHPYAVTLATQPYGDQARLDARLDAMINRVLKERL